ncbi:MAG TPA: hypothetical protein VLZ31_02640 [Microbacteriaceae bacterium]|nr:hypothetical protein [Microbacteriaceae bacterium]
MESKETEFYVNAETGVFRSSNPKEIASSVGLKLEADTKAIYEFLRFGKLPEGDKSFFLGIKRDALKSPKSGTFLPDWRAITSDSPQDFARQIAELVKTTAEPFSLAESSYDPSSFIDKDFLAAQETQGKSEQRLHRQRTLDEAARKDLTDWLLAVKTGVYYVLMSPEFYDRPFFMQRNAAVGFSDFLREKDAAKADVFWRFLIVEMWFRVFIDETEDTQTQTKTQTKTATSDNTQTYDNTQTHDNGPMPDSDQTSDVPQKLDTEPNEGKNLDIEVSGVTYRRYPLRTKSITRGDGLEEYVGARLKEFQLSTKDIAEPWWEKPWSVFISEKIVAITQTRSFFVWEIEPGWWARKLSSRITPSSYGYGLSIPWTMELAIREVGLPRILLASAGSVLGKLIGKAGVFYMIAGAGVRAIDGPLESPVYPSFLSAKLAPKDTDKTASKISTAIRKSLPDHVLKNFQGTVIIDANDVGRHVLGKDVAETNETLESIFEDNPLGQGGQRTPVSVVYPV